VKHSVYDHISGKLSDLDAEVVRHVPPGGNWRNLPNDFQSKRIAQIRSSAAAGEGSRSTYYGRLCPTRPSYTISTYFNRPGNGCFIHPVAPRLISVREAARLQGFPDAFRFSGRGRARYLQVGNAVPPLLAFQVASSLMVSQGAAVADLFSGAGGLALGFEWAGYDVVAAVDADASCVATQVANGVPQERVLSRDLSEPAVLTSVLDEIVALNGGKDVEVLIGGPPCQGFSTAGKNELNDPRNRLVKVFLEAVSVLRPAVVLMENVPALTFKRNRSTLCALVDTLANFGYEVDIAVLHAEAYGVPQLRRRLFVQGRLDGEAASWPVPHREILSPHQITLQPNEQAGGSLPYPTTVDDAIGDLPLGTSRDPDQAIPYQDDPSTSFQEWARSDEPPTQLVPPVNAQTPRQAALGAL
jgi:DNA (cytosine-5)-methyltransferase 1